AMEEYGGIVHEREFLEFVSPKDAVTQNVIHFLLVLGDAFAKLKEDDAFHHRWTTDHDLAHAIHQSLNNLCVQISENDLLNEDELIDVFKKNLLEHVPADSAEKHSRRWLQLSKEVGQSPI